jgi:transcriptional regulator with XRE-family HTH domain
MDMTFIPERLRKARLERKLSQKELAARTFFAPSTISSIENGLISPSERAVRLLAQTLGKKVSYFIDPAIDDADSDETHPAENRLLDDTPLEKAVDALTAVLDICRVLVQRGRYKEALQQLDELDLSQANEGQRIRADFIRAQALMRTGEARRARLLLQEIIGLLQSKPLPPPVPTLAQARFELGASYFIDQLLDDALDSYKAALDDLGPSADENPLGFNLYAEIARVLRQKGEVAQAREYYQKAYNHRQAVKDDRVMANTLLSEGMALSQEGKLEEARARLLESERLYEKLDQIEQARTVASYLAVVQAELGQDVALPSEIEAKSLPENSSATSELIVMSNEAQVLRIKGQHDPAILQEAAARMERTLQFMKLKADEIRKQTIAEVYFEAAKLWVALDRREEALAAFEQSLQALRDSQARWYRYEKVYEEYERALLEWENATELLKMSQARLKDRKAVNNQG